MKDKFNLKVNGLGPIDEANIEIGRINVVGGLNGTGKSTASKLLYSFLRSTSSHRNDFAYGQVSEEIRAFIRTIYGRYGIKKPNYAGPDFSSVKFYTHSEPLYFDDLSLIEKYEQAKNDFYEYGVEHPLNDFIEEDIKEIDDILSLINDNGNKLFISLFKNVLNAEFNTNIFYFDAKFSGIKNGVGFDVSINLKDNLWDSQNSFKSNGLFEIEDVFYIDSFSFFETHTQWVGPTHHVGYLHQILNPKHQEAPQLFDEKFNKSIVDIEKKVGNIIGGEIVFDKGYKFVAYDSKPIDMYNTASGIKQIGVIQLLLAKRKLKKDSFLIIDEPEVNLHPDWQFKFARILVLLAKELNITIYLNTHSPMFIEAIEVFTQFYDLEDDTNYYLTKKSENAGYNFKRIDKDNLYELYDNLAKPYDSIEVYRLKAEYKKENSP